MTEPKQRPIFDALNKPLLIMGVDRRIFVLAAVVLAACYWAVRGGQGLLLGLILGGLIRYAGIAGAKRDPEFVSLFLASWRLRGNYRAGAK